MANKLVQVTDELSRKEQSSINRSEDPDPISHKHNDENIINDIDHTMVEQTTSTSTNSILVCVPVFMFISISMIVGVLIVHLTTPRSQEKQCVPTYQRILNQKRQYNSLTRSTAAGDFNNDHYMDVVVANYGADNIGILLGNGDGTFSSQITYSTGKLSSPYFVTTNDFNNDTILDIIVANFGTNSVGIFLGNSNGSFMSQKTFSTGASRPIAVAIGNFNNDKQIDIAIVNYGTNSIVIFLGLQNETFTSPITYSTAYDSDPRSLAIDDFNNDNIQDIAVANYGTNNFGIFFGFGNGSFRNQQLFLTGVHSRPYSIAIADLNRDNRSDIIITNTGSDSISVFLGSHNEIFLSQLIFSTGIGSNPHSLTVADVNKDAVLDIVVANSGSDSIGVLLGYGNGSFASMQTYSTTYGSNPQCISVGDFNNDNRIDIIVANNGSNSMGILLSDRSIAFEDQINYSNDYSTYPYGLAIGDLNNDNCLDIVVANSGTDNIGVFFGFGNGTFSDSTILSTGDGSSPTMVNTADFNKDHRLDLVVANFGNDNVGVFLGYGNGSFASQIRLSTGYQSWPRFTAVGDFNNDHCLDIIVANYGTANIGILLGHDNGSFSEQTTFSTCSGCLPISLAVADFNNDNNLDFVTVYEYGNNIVVFFGNGNGTFPRSMTYSAGEQSSTTFVNVDDLNNDHWMDIIVSRAHRDTMVFFLGTGNGSFGDPISYYTGYQSVPVVVVTGDLNNDNISDIVVSNDNANYLSIYRGLGNGTFSSNVQYHIKSTVTRNFVALGDVNRDNRLDIILANYDGSFIAILIGYDPGTFNSMMEFSTSYALLPSSLVITDFNRDNQMDIGVSNYASSNVDIYLGNNNGSSMIKQTFSTGDNSHPWMISSADLNNDSFLDIVAANTGQDNIGILFGYGNGSFQTTQMYSTGDGSRPYFVAIGDVNNDNRSDLAVANYGTNNMGIMLRYDVGSFSTIPILNPYVTSQARSLTQLAIGDFNNDNWLDIVFVEYETDIIGILLTYNNGTSTRPIIYLNSSGNAPLSVAIGDFNSDKHLDIIVANDATDMIDLFFGNGNGTFIDQIVYSNDYLYYPAALAVGHFNNDNYLDIVVANYDASTIYILFGDDDGTFANQITLSTGDGSSPTSLDVGDFNNDNHLDIAVANYDADSIGIFFGFGNTTFADQISYSTTPGTEPISVAVGDLNNDKQLDFIAINYDNGFINVYLGSKNGTFTNATIIQISDASQPMSVALADINNDNRLDAIICSNYLNTVYLLLGYGNGAFANSMRFGANQFYNPQQVLIADFNRDSRLDCLVMDYYRIYVFYGSVQESYLPITTFSTGNQSLPRSISIGDLNNDNQPDIIVANSGSGNIGVFFGLGFGSFQDQTTFLTGNGSMPYFVAVGNFNNDNRLDIAVANYGTGNVGVFLGRGNGNFTSQSIYSTGPISNPYSLALGDVNNDGQLDIIMTNFHSNYLIVLFGVGDGTFVNTTIIHTGYGSFPSYVALGDLNNDYLLDIAITNYGFGNIEIFSKIC